MRLHLLCAASCALLFVTGSAPTTADQPADGPTPLGTAFTYQGRLDENGQPANGLFDMVFDLYDAPSGGSFFGSDEVLVQVTDGLFTVELDYGKHLFGTGEARWLEIEVNKVALAPRQPLTAAPYSIQVRGVIIDDDGMEIVRPAGVARIRLESGALIPGTTIEQDLAGDFNIRLGTGTNVLNVWGGQVLTLGLDNDGLTVRSGIVIPEGELEVTSQGGGAIVAQSPNGNNIIEARSPTETEFFVTDLEAVFSGRLRANGDLEGLANGSINGSLDVGGDLIVAGTISKGGGGFTIDHPLDPENRYLAHSFVESPDMMNVYNGNAVLDDRGEATIVLPAWFEALNRDFRYQLTAIGGAAPYLHIAEEIAGNRFRIAGGEPGLKVSWQVTGIRKDPYAEAHPIVVEQEKGPEQRGRFLHPEAYGHGR